MILRPRTVTIKHLPSRVDHSTERALLRELALALQVERPAIVLDCSQLRQMDSAAAHLLLCCLEEAMKRNGDVRLAGLSDQAGETLAAWDLDRIFRSFETTEKAAESFQRRSAFIAPAAERNTAALATERAA
jgi:anti-sigma B factor antagonist